MKLFKGSFQLVWDSTSLKAFKACPRKYQYMMIDKIRRRGANIHLAWGIALHSALEAYDHAKALGLTEDEATYRAVQKALAAELPESEEKTKTKETLVRSVVWYLDHYAEDPAKTYILADGRPGVELSFKFHLTSMQGMDVYWAGHLDRLVEYNEQLWFMDRKTTKSQLDRRYFSQFAPDLQMYGYAFAGRVAFATPVVGGIVDAIQVGVTFSRFARHLLHIRDTQLDEWLAGVQWALEQAHACAEREEWPMNEAACNNYFGCEYRNLCAHAPSERPFYMDDYERFDWNPLEER